MKEDYVAKACLRDAEYELRRAGEVHLKDESLKQLVLQMASKLSKFLVNSDLWQDMDNLYTPGEQQLDMRVDFCSRRLAAA